jgi:hypothetical protein
MKNSNILLKHEKYHILNKKKRIEKVILVDYFTFDNFHSFKWVDFFSSVVNFRC